jgi:uncharacterized phage protein (TIGR01671 family)
MREIKFRAWTGLKMEYDIIVGRFGAFYVSAGDAGDGLDPRDKGSLTIFNTIFSDTTPIMQYTGRKDKNGKEIYEGDNLFCKAQNYKGQVFFYNGSFMSDCCGFGETELSNINSEDIEIIGNIHENGELLNDVE